jgi:hypothetical protein
VHRASAFVIAALSVCAWLAGCASNRTPATRATVAGANTPQAAAIGFDRSVRDSGDLKFECLPGNKVDFFGSVVTGKPTASVTRAGARWVVTLRYPSDSLNWPRYQVRHVAGGYCVSRMLADLHPSVGRSSPVPYSGSATSSPPR